VLRSAKVKSSLSLKTKADLSVFFDESKTAQWDGAFKCLIKKISVTFNKKKKSISVPAEQFGLYGNSSPPAIPV